MYILFFCFSIKTTQYACRKYNTYQLLTFISEPSNLNFSDSVMQKCSLGRETLKMKIVLGLELDNFLLDTARIMYANTYESGLTQYFPES